MLLINGINDSQFFYDKKPLFQKMKIFSFFGMTKIIFQLT
jgi:hypothetical protein